MRYFSYVSFTLFAEIIRLGGKSKKERRFGNKKQGKTALVVEGAIMQVMES